MVTNIQLTPSDPVVKLSTNDQYNVDKEYTTKLTDVTKRPGGDPRTSPLPPLHVKDWISECASDFMFSDPQDEVSGGLFDPWLSED